jgi:hypothetical protein
MMRKRIVSKIVFLVIAASVIGLFGCDQEKNDSNEKLLLGMAASGHAPWMVILPASGAINIVYKPVITLQYNGTLEGTVDTESISLIHDTFTLNLNNTTSAINISGNIVTFIPNNSLASGTIYHSITISGFKDGDGNNIDSCSIPDYNFTTEPK